MLFQFSNNILVLLATTQPDFICASPVVPVQYPSVIGRLFAAAVRLVKRLSPYTVLAFVGGQVLFEGVNILQDFV